ncbi:glutamate-5-semialdehyde dehydrogenase [uncultured Acetobacteroides sp.]|uniref:glutamate-5-semialdehyde dehydrogenase n=1 Tax=uncultured Acetobacteroides sp. TaxID=1760811 RepID=UPI0029F57F8E|nr:glutamate-5-semialdehyde dehydrogenase [uncultured Acetobacteroides sp.]
MGSIKSILENTQRASRAVGFLDDALVGSILNAVADRAIAHADVILKANAKDAAAMRYDDPRYDRLLLSGERIEAIASDLRNVAELPSPLNRIREQRTLANGLKLTKVSVPLGVVGVIFEARPNVTFDVFALCLKSGNATILKGGSDAHHSNVAIVSLIKSVLTDFGVDTNIVNLLPIDRVAAAELLSANGLVDVIIPRGGQALINFVRKHSSIPIIETGAGICHTYFESSGDSARGQAIITNAKTRRVSVCNALDCLVIDRERLPDLPFLCAKLAEKKVTIYADARAYVALDENYPAELLQHAADEHFGTEFLDYKMSIKTVNSFDEALDHIATYSSKHSEAIISEDKDRVDQFLKRVDAAAVYANASTAFTDGAQFGLGAEIGISTQKLHARGPMGVEELTSYKWIVEGNGQVRQ